MTHGRTIWWAKDAAWYDREALVLLGEEFGAEGTTVMDVLSCQAKLENHDGYVKTGYVSLTRKGNISDEKTTRAIVARAVEIGALDDFTEDRLTFTARVSGWKADQELASSAERQRRYRERLRQQEDGERRTGSSVEEGEHRTGSQGEHRMGSEDVEHRTGSVTDRNVTSPSRKVTLQDSTGQDRTEEETTLVEPGLDAAGTVDRTVIVKRLFTAWQGRCGHPNAKLTRERRRRISDRLAEGYTEEQIRVAIDGAARAAFVNDTGKRFDDIELICRNGSKLESFIDRASGTLEQGQRGRPSRREQVIADRGDYLRFYDTDGRAA